MPQQFVFLRFVHFDYLLPSNGIDNAEDYQQGSREEDGHEDRVPHPVFAPELTVQPAQERVQRMMHTHKEKKKTRSEDEQQKRQ